LIDWRIKNFDQKREKTILFLSRIEKTKGICEAIAAIKTLENSKLKVNLKVAGNGSYLNEAKKYARELNISNKVHFLGYLKGNEKRKAYLNADLYILPTYHGEGMPNAVLEAMAFGLPVITTSVGGIKDFFNNEEHGFMAENRDPHTIASLIERILTNKNMWIRMSLNTHSYAINRFLASKVARRIERIYTEIL
jgi:glycosyltransferase involved in cell wall biosynthesis